jgi:hypothetical protein
VRKLACALPCGSLLPGIGLTPQKATRTACNLGLNSDDGELMVCYVGPILVACQGGLL